MTFDFDAPVDRRGTGSDKWDKYRGRDVIPLWVADMDFRAPPAVLQALHARIEHGVFGYTSVTDELVQAVLQHLQRDFQWQVQPQWLVWLPGLVTGLNVACRAVGEDGDDVLTATPVYPPFLSAPRFQRRNLLTVALQQQGSGWYWDFDALERAVSASTRLFLLCNPHNPVGRVFTRAELEQLAALCERRDMVICSDEIHCGLVLDSDKQHVPIAALSPQIAERTITLMAPSKTYNIPGLYCSFAVISNTALRQRFLKAMQRIVPHVNALGYTAALAAYQHGGAWQQALLGYLRGNRDLVARRVAAMPALSANHVEATYLTWLDARQLGLAKPQQWLEQHGVGLSDGADFGAPGFVRLNFGCRRALLETALDRIDAALAQLGRSKGNQL